MSKRTPKIQKKKQTAQTVSAVRRARTNSIATDFVSNKTFLYQFVYSTRTSFVVTFMLLLSFALPGTQLAEAAEEEVSTTAEASSPSALVTPVDEPAPAERAEEEPETIPATEYEVPEEVTETVSTTEEQPTEFDSGEETELGNQTGVEDENADSSDSGPAPVPETDDGENNNVSSEGAPEEDTEPGNEPGSPVNESEEDQEQTSGGEEASPEENEATSTEETLVAVGENTFETISSVQNDTAFSFTRDQCTQLASGSFYCLEPQENTLADALFAAPDADGDMEIFFVRDSQQTQITNNTADDTAPYYDQNTHTIVWHRLVDDRYQIISYDVAEGEEEQLTRTSENNMEPTRQGTYTVWQRWIDGGWNIILFDGESEEQLTNTVSHNIAPYIHGTLVVWNRLTSTGDKTIEMYDMSTKTYVTIDDSEGLSVSNPRMVFVYDSLHPNGDIVTKGYDVLARKFVDLDTLPRDLPEDIPHSDSTGETRALIQSKPTLKSEVEEMTGGTGSTTPVLPPPPAPSAEALTLDMSATSSPVVPVTPAVIEVESFDLVIPPLETMATATEAVQE